MSEASWAIRLEDVRKEYRLYQRHETTLKEVVLRRRRGIYTAFRALDGVSFEVPEGEVVGVIGRNGSGKSTLLKLIARIVEPDRGRVETRGRVSALLEVGAGFHPEYSAIENIFLSGAIYGLRRAELRRRVDDIIAFAELERFADNPVKTYSSGMYARLGFSIAVNVDPDVLLVDEVLAVGDQSFQARCLERMLEFRDAGKTILLVTHDVGAVESFCDRAIWIDAGRVRDDDLPHHVVRAYLTSVNAGDERRSAGEVADRGTAVAGHVPINPAHPVWLRAMSFVGDDGEEREVFHNGERMRVRVHYGCSEPVQTPLCEVRIERHDHVHVTTASTGVAGFEVPVMPAGEGYFEWEIEDVSLTPGTYYFSPVLFERTGIHAYDLHPRWYRVRVHAGAYREREGVVVMPGRWSFSASEAAPAGAGTPGAGSGLGSRAPGAAGTARP